MPRQQQTGSSGLNPSQALYVLDRLIRERRVRSSEVTRMASEMNSEIADLERRLAMLRGDTGGSGKVRGRSGRPGRPVNPAVAASRRLQGEYMGLMRHISGRERARVKKIAAEKGREAAVREMRTQIGR